MFNSFSDLTPFPAIIIRAVMPELSKVTIVPVLPGFYSSRPDVLDQWHSFFNFFFVESLNFISIEGGYIASYFFIFFYISFDIFLYVIYFFLYFF